MTPGIIKIVATTKIKTTRYDNGEVMSKTPYARGKKHGLRIEWYDSGKKGREEMWKEDKIHGMTRCWWQNGSKWQERTWGNGQEHGLRIEWYENGQKREEIYHLRGEEYARISWDEEGNITEINFPNSTLNNKLHNKPSKKIKKPPQEAYLTPFPAC